MTRNERCRRPTPMRSKTGAMTVIVVVISSLLLLVNSEAIPHMNDNRRINRRSLQATATGLLGSVACTGCAEASCLAVGTIGDAHCAQCAKGQTWWPCDQGTFIWWTNVNLLVRNTLYNYTSLTHFLLLKLYVLHCTTIIHYCFSGHMLLQIARDDGPDSGTINITF